MALQAASENLGGGLGGEGAAIEKEHVIGCGAVTRGGKFHDGDAGMDEAAEGLLAAIAETAIAIADGHDPGGAVGALQLRDLKVDGELARSITSHVARRPLHAANDGDSGGECGGIGRGRDPLGGGERGRE